MTNNALGIKAALAIINSTVNPAMRHDAVNVNARNLAEIIERETAASDLLEALKYQEMADADPAASRRKGYYEEPARLRKAAIAKAEGRGG